MSQFSHHKFSHHKHKNKIDTKLNISFHTFKGHHVSFRIDFFLIILILVILISASSSYIYLYYKLEKNYVNLKINYEQEKKDKEAQEEINKNLKLEINSLNEQFISTKEELDSILEYKKELEKNSFIRRLSQ